MKYFRLVLILIFSLMLLTFFVEILEFALVMLLSNQTFMQLSQNQEAYFEFRNQMTVLIAKPVYTFLFAFLVSFYGGRFLKFGREIYYVILAIIQTFGICYGAFLSEYKSSLPIWYWFLILLMILSGFKLAYRLTKK